MTKHLVFVGDTTQFCQEWEAGNCAQFIAILRTIPSATVVLANTSWSEFMTSVVHNAHTLLKDSGFLAVSINATELFRLQPIVSDVFGVKNFVGIFPVKIRHKDRQLMVNAVFHDVYEYLLIWRKTLTTRFNCEYKPPDLSKFVWMPKPQSKPEIATFADKQVEIYSEYCVEKLHPSRKHLRRYIIAGKIKTANWSGEWFENYLRDLGPDLLCKVAGLETAGLGYRWFETQTDSRLSGVYYSSCGNDFPILPSNDLDCTEIVTQVHKEGGDGCDFKDSKKPLVLLSWMLQICTQPRDLVVDLFAGSGTTAHAAWLANRSSWSVENNPHAIEIIRTRCHNVGIPATFFEF